VDAQVEPAEDAAVVGVAGKLARVGHPAVEVLVHALHERKLKVVLPVAGEPEDVFLHHLQSAGECRVVQCLGELQRMHRVEMEALFVETGPTGPGGRVRGSEENFRPLVEVWNDRLPRVDEFEAELLLEQGIEAIGDALGAGCGEGKRFSVSLSEEAGLGPGKPMCGVVEIGVIPPCSKILAIQLGIGRGDGDGNGGAASFYIDAMTGSVEQGREVGEGICRDRVLADGGVGLDGHPQLGWAHSEAKTDA
jgi:hypothetical protein